MDKALAAQLESTDLKLECIDLKLASYVATATKQEQLEHQLENQLLRLLLQKRSGDKI